MAVHAVTLRLPASLYDFFSNRAERAQRSLEAELLDAIATVVADEEKFSHEPSGAARLVTDSILQSNRAGPDPPDHRR